MAFFMNRPIGVFDSGIGGISVLKEIIKEIPGERYIYLADSKNAPYGKLSRRDIIKFSEDNVRYLISKDVKLIVVACNTATAAAVHHLRAKFIIPIVGLEPAIKPACLKTKTGNIGVLATKGTFRGNHFKNTSNKYKNYVKIYLKIAEGLVEMAEKGEFESNQAKILLKKYLKSFDNKNIDHIVLGCTHYPFFYDTIKSICGNEIEIIDSGEAVARRTKDILMTGKMLNNKMLSHTVELLTTGDITIIKKIAEKHMDIGSGKWLVEKVNIPAENYNNI